jgi:hypothetical protein
VEEISFAAFRRSARRASLLAMRADVDGRDGEAPEA